MSGIGLTRPPDTFPERLLIELAFRRVVSSISIGLMTNSDIRDSTRPQKPTIFKFQTFRTFRTLVACPESPSGIRKITDLTDEIKYSRHKTGIESIGNTDAVILNTIPGAVRPVTFRILMDSLNFLSGMSGIQ